MGWKASTVLFETHSQTQSSQTRNKDTHNLKQRDLAVYNLLQNRLFKAFTMLLPIVLRSHPFKM